MYGKNEFESAQQTKYVWNDFIDTKKKFII